VHLQKSTTEEVICREADKGTDSIGVVLRGRVVSNCLPWPLGTYGRGTVPSFSSLFLFPREEERRIDIAFSQLGLDSEQCP
jgi:hypothetical protein